MCQQKHLTNEKISPESESEQAQSLFLGVMGSPFDNDLATSVFRISEATLKVGKELTIWTCGYATQITQTTNVRTVDPISSIKTEDHDHHTLAQMAQALFRQYPQQLRWYVCQYCMEERGATSQIHEVEIMLPFSFNSYLSQADQSLVLGVK